MTMRDSRGRPPSTHAEPDYEARSAAPILVDGRIWGALALATFRREPFPSWAESRLNQFAELVSLAIAAADTHERLLESRRRLVLSADTERRRIERNLHDGAQQRLVSLAITLRLARDNIVFAPKQALSTIDAASEELSQALAELRELARGLHPSILSERGLEPALRSLADRAPVPVDVTIGFAERLPEAVEVAAYFVVAEALTNAAKYAQASAVTVHLSSRDQAVLVSVRDDGIGGADITAGSGLRGLADRVEALSGRIDIVSGKGGTCVTAELPIGPR